MAILTTGLASTLIIILGFAGARVQEAYLFLIDITIIVYFIPYVYLFASLIKLARTGRPPEGAIPVPGGVGGATAVGLLGLVTTLAALLFTLSPPEGTDPFWFLTKVIGGCAILVFLGWTIYARGRREPGDPPR